MSSPRIVSFTERQTQNVGDLSCSPFLYYPFGDIQDVRSPVNLASDDVAVIGGGGLFHPGFVPALERIRSITRHIVVWGVGTNTHDTQEKVDYPTWLSECEMVGLRDDTNPFGWVPCPSCKSSLFTRFRNTPPTRLAVVFRHAGYDDLPSWTKQLPELTNDASMEAAISFLSSAEFVFTNTYHGMYWATLLSRRVIVFPFASRFYHMRHAPAFAYPGDSKEHLMKWATVHGSALQECIEANDRFAARFYAMVKLRIK